VGCINSVPLGELAYLQAKPSLRTPHAELIRSGGRKLASALEHSGLEPPDTLLLTWSEFMSIEEALEHDLVATLLEDARDNGELDPSRRGWRQRQTKLVERYLSSPDVSGTAPLTRIHAARREAWLELPGRGDDRELLEHALASIDAHSPSPAEAEEAIEPLLWLLDRLAGGVKLTQTGALPRVLVRAAVERYPDWWDTATVGPPRTELYPLCVLHDLIDQLRLARRRRSILQLAPKGRTLRADPQRLLSELAAALARNSQSSSIPCSPVSSSTTSGTRSTGRSAGCSPRSTGSSSTNAPRQP
jgi:hypothetical protein